MAGKSTGLIKAFRAAGAIPARALVKLSADDAVVVATAVGDAIIGVSGELDTADGEICDVQLSGIAEVKLGGNVTRGDFITAAAAGEGVTAAPAAGTNNNVLGRAFASGVDGDIVAVLLAPGRIQG